MGRSRTPTYRVEFGNSTPPGMRGYGFTNMAWRREYGRPTNENVRKHVESMVESFKPGGVNEHVSRDAGYVPVPKFARVVRQSDGQVMAEWRQPMFMVV